MAESIFNKTIEYFTEKLRAHGASPLGVDWNGVASQELRFLQLAKLLDHETSDNEFSLLDYGCGYGQLYLFLIGAFPKMRFTGFDIAPEMIASAQKLYPQGEWTTTLKNHDKNYDYVIASGIFNMKFDFDYDAWEAYVVSELDKFHELSHKGMAFNFLTQYSDKEKMRPDLFYADPCKFFDLCKRKYARNVALLHDYGAYDFTIIVRKYLG